MKWPEDHILQLKREGVEFALCTIVNTRGSAPRQIGAKMIVRADGSIAGTIGGGELEKQAIIDAVKSIESGKAQLFRYDLLHQLNMCCGGTVELFIEPVMKPKRLYIFGAGHVGAALAQHASALEFDVYVIDERKEMMDAVRTENVSKMKLPVEQALTALPFDEQTYVCIMTYSHPLDREILAQCISKSHAYIGMIGSLRKTEVTKKMFREAQLATDEQLNEVDMPMGVPIAAEGPEEIAISILARLIEVKNKISRSAKPAAVIQHQ